MNSIYEYYEKVSDRYFLARLFNEGSTKRIRHLWNPLAKPAKITGYEAFDLFIYNEGRNLCLAEGLTGSVIINQKDMPTRELRRCKQQRFCEAAQAILRSRGGIGEINVMIINFLSDYEQQISPRYKPVQV
jgi:hypothetical protein